MYKLELWQHQDRPHQIAEGLLVGLFAQQTPCGIQLRWCEGSGQQLPIQRFDQVGRTVKAVGL